MNKQELIDALDVRKKIIYKNFFDASKDFDDQLQMFGRYHITTIRAGEIMESLNTKIDDINEFIELLESLED